MNRIKTNNTPTKRITKFPSAYEVNVRKNITRFDKETKEAKVFLDLVDTTYTRVFVFDRIQDMSNLLELKRATTMRLYSHQLLARDLKINRRGVSVSFRNRMKIRLKGLSKSDKQILDEIGKSFNIMKDSVYEYITKLAGESFKGETGVLDYEYLDKLRAIGEAAVDSRNKLKHLCNEDDNKMTDSGIEEIKKEIKQWNSLIRLIRKVLMQQDEFREKLYDFDPPGQV